MKREADGPLRQLTPREWQVALLLCDDPSYGTIGATLHMSAHTVRRHVQNIAQKLQNPHAHEPKTLVRLWASAIVAERQKSDAPSGRSGDAAA